MSKSGNKQPTPTPPPATRWEDMLDAERIGQLKARIDQLQTQLVQLAQANQVYSRLLRHTHGADGTVLVSITG